MQHRGVCRVCSTTLPPCGSAPRRTSSAAATEHSSWPTSCASTRGPAPPERWARFRPRARTSRPPWSTARRTSLAVTQARAGWTRSSRGDRARPRAQARASVRPTRVDNVYADDTAGKLSATVMRARPLVYVPNSLSNTVDEIDPRTYRVVRSFPVGALPQHVTPSWDLRTLYVLNDVGNSITPIDPRTGA